MGVQTHRASEVDAGEESVSVRTCVTCREPFAASTLLRVGLKGGHLKFDRRAEKGRSAWICPTKSCVAKLSPQILGRAFRSKGVQFPEEFEPVGYLWSRASQVVFELLGLARRAGKLRIGGEAIVKAGLPDHEDSFIIAANDLSERTQKLYQGRQGPWSGVEMAKAVGLQKVGVLAIEPSGFAIDAQFWFGLLRSLSPDTQSSARQK